MTSAVDMNSGTTELPSTDYSSLSLSTPLSEQAIPLSEQVSPLSAQVSPQLFWEQIRDSLGLERQIASAWLKPIVAKEVVMSDGSATLVLEAPNRFSAEHVKRQYGPQICRVAAELMDRTVVSLSLNVSLAAVSGAQSPVAATPSALKKIEAGDGLEQILHTKFPRNQATPSSVSSSVSSSLPRVAKRRTVVEGNLNPKYNFSNFVVGACNQFAHAAGLQVAENLGSTYNPLFIYGGVGLGKTHLVNSIGNASRRRGKNVLLVSSEAFVNELITALRSNRMQQFKSRFRSLDLLIIDDVQFIIGKERTQEEFFHTFNELHQRQKQIILTSDKLPQELTGLEERLRTRFASGLSADLQAPDFETRVAILVKKAESLGVHLTDDIAQFVGSQVSTNVRELEGALNRIVALQSLQKSGITMKLAEEAIRGCIPARRAEISTESIQRSVAESYSVSVSDLLGKRRTQNIALSRQVAMFLCRRLTGCSYPEIGALFGGRDHSTVIHATRVIEGRMGEDRDFKADVERLITALQS